MPPRATSSWHSRVHCGWNHPLFEVHPIPPSFRPPPPQVDTSARAVTLSKIFKWYYPDFGSTKAERLRFLLPYLPADKRAALEGLLAGDPGAGRITVNYREYSWDLNGEE